MATQVQVANLALVRIGERKPLTALTDQTVSGITVNAIFAALADEVLETFPWPFANSRALLKDLKGGLALSGVASIAYVQLSGWAQSYLLPADCIIPRYIYAGIRDPLPKDRIPMEVVAFPGPYPWDSSLTYAKNDWVLDPAGGGANSWHQSLVDNNLNNIPPDDASNAYWSDLGEAQTPIVGTSILLTDHPNPELVYTARPPISAGPPVVPNYPPSFSDALAWRLAIELAGGLAQKDKMRAYCAQQYELALGRAVTLGASEKQGQEPDSELIQGRS